MHALQIMTYGMRCHVRKKNYRSPIDTASVSGVEVARSMYISENGTQQHAAVVTATKRLLIRFAQIQRINHSGLHRGFVVEKNLLADGGNELRARYIL